MVWFIRPLSEKHFHAKYLGRVKRYRLARNDSSIAFQGALLSFYHCRDDQDGQDFEGRCHVDLAAVFKTRGGRFIVYYVVDYPPGEHIEGRHEYVHVCRTEEELARFLSEMHYPNRSCYLDTLRAALPEDMRPPAPEASPESSPDASPDAIPASAPITTPEAAGATPPRTAPDIAPEAAPEATAATGPDTRPAPTAASAPDAPA